MTPKMKAKLVIRIGRSRIRAASIAASITRCALAFGALGELDHQDRILRRQAHGRDQADLQIDVVLKPAQRHEQDRADQAERDHQQHRDRDRPAFVKRREAQEDDDQRNAVEDRRLPRRQPLLVGLARPGDADARESARRASSMMSIASPELTPGAPWPEISNDG